VDEDRGILYAAYYNGAEGDDIRGDLSICDAATRVLMDACDLARMGRSLRIGPVTQCQVYVWGVQLSGGRVYASYMLTDLEAHPAFLPPG